MTEPKTIASAARAQAATHCFHCGNSCRAGQFAAREHSFCCHGCQTVFELLTENGLADFYKLDANAGVRAPGQLPHGRFEFLDEPAVRQRMVNFSNAKTTRVVLQIPAIHCIACVWLLENLFRLNSAIAGSQVNFLRKEVTLNFATDGARLSEIVTLLTSLGYEPELKLADLDAKPRHHAARKLWMQIGVAGFAFGNNMLFAIAIYLGVDALHGPAFQKLVGYLSFALAIPVLLFSAQDYFRLAWQGLKQRRLTIEVPIAAGILVIFAQSAWEVILGRGVGYFDSFAGLLFFLLCGRLFQQKTYERLSFDRDYKSFFPLSVTRQREGREEHVSLSEIQPGDRLVIRNGELIPADAKLTRGQAMIDYSFVTGEADWIPLTAGEYVYAGGRHMGELIELEATKSVSQSYLTSLWNQDAFKKSTDDSLDSLINRYSQRFTKLVVAISLGAAAFWLAVDPSKALLAATSILIVACPCALALAAPFALGTAIRVLGRRNAFVKSPQVIERLAKIDTVVFDKTGTLTGSGELQVKFIGAALREFEKRWIYSVARQSIHPHSVRIAESIKAAPLSVRSVVELSGCGIKGSVEGREILLGSEAWLKSQNIAVPAGNFGGASHLAINGQYRGVFILPTSVRNGVASMVRNLAGDYRLALLSGDNERESAQFETIFGPTAILKFAQSPLDKLNFIHNLQQHGRKVAMVGDGLNDAGALKQSDVGVAVVETVGAFSPASDVIMRVDLAPELDTVLRFSKGVTKIVRLSFGISTLYNVAGIAIAASANLAPIVCAILMPLSSISVVAFACAATTWYARHLGLGAEEKR